MDSPPPPDPYLALGVSKTADAGEIKSAYRKLVLRCHPDKISDATQKAKAVEEFHKVQQAYELISDEEKRGRYDAMVRLAELRRQKLEARGGSSSDPRVDVRTAAYDIRTAAPQQASFTARGPTRTYATDERRPNFSTSDEETSRASARKSPREYTYVRRSAAPKTADRERDEERRKAGRRRDVEREADRSSKYEYAAFEDFTKHEESRRRRDKEAQEDSSRKSPHRRDAPEDRTSRLAEEARAYMASSQRPTSFERTTSTREVPYAYVRRPTMDARDRRSTRDSIPRESRRGPEIVESSRPTTLRHHDSDPVGVASAAHRHHREKPEHHRSYTTQTDSDHRKSTEEPLPSRLSRSQTMPIQPNTSSTRRPPPPPSKLRTSDNGPDSGYSSPATPDRAYPPPPPGPPPASNSKSTFYSYSGPANPSTAAAKDYSTTYREPVSGSAPQPPPLRRMSTEQERGPSGTTKTARMMASLAGQTRPSSSRQTSYSTTSGYDYRASRSPERGSGRDGASRSARDYAREPSSRSSKLYGEVDPGYVGRDPRGRTTFAPEEVSYSRRYSPDDVVYSNRSGKDKRSSVYVERPARLSRQGTAVY